LEVLLEAGVVVPAETPVAGSSGGAILALAAHSGAPAEATHAALEALAERCRPWACTFTQDAAVREAIGRIVDAGEEAAAAASSAAAAQGHGGQVSAVAAATTTVVERCRGKAFASIAVAFGRGGLAGELRRCAAAGAGGDGSRPQASPSPLLSALLPAPAACALRAVHRWWWRPALWVVGDDWRDRADLADGVAASCFFPALSSPTRPWATLRGRSRLIDGVFAAPLPLPPPPPASDKEGDGAAAAARRRPVRVSAVPLGTSAAPLSRPIVEAEVAPFLRVGADAAAIPGLPSARAWRRFLLVVPSAEQRAAMRELGRREAFAWWSEEAGSAQARQAGGEEQAVAGVAAS
jgi:hypothetical protein